MLDDISIRTFHIICVGRTVGQEDIEEGVAWHLPRRSLRKGTGALGHCCRQNGPGDNVSPSAQLSLLEVQICVIEMSLRHANLLEKGVVLVQRQFVIPIILAA